MCASCLIRANAKKKSTADYSILRTTGGTAAGLTDKKGLSSFSAIPLLQPLRVDFNLIEPLTCAFCTVLSAKAWDTPCVLGWCSSIW